MPPASAGPNARPPSGGGVNQSPSLTLRSDPEPRGDDVDCWTHSPTRETMFLGCVLGLRTEARVAPSTSSRMSPVPVCHVATTLW